jgi:hypothetical protein
MFLLVFIDISREIEFDYGISLEVNKGLGAFVIEGFDLGEYPEVVDRFKIYIATRENSYNLDFLNFIDLSWNERLNELKDVKNLFVYNFDAFGNGIDVEKAKDGIADLKSGGSRYDMYQLILARPNADLDYECKEGRSFHSNDPLGNWCRFFRVDGDQIISKPDVYPIRRSN